MSEPWVNPSRSYPLLAVARHHSVPYGVVLRYAEGLSPGLTAAQQEALDAELAMYPNFPPRVWNQSHWMTSTIRAVREWSVVRTRSLT